MRDSIAKNVIMMACLISIGANAACKRESKSEGAGAPGGANAQGGRGAAVPVVASQVLKKEMPIELRAIGNVRPSVTVTVKPRVGGIIATVNFQEGQDVKAADVLYTIDPKPFEVALAQAEAALAQTRELAANAEQQARRYSTLGKTGAVAKEQLDLVQSTARGATSAQLVAEAAVKEAEIQLGYCVIKSPTSGRAGRRMVDAGNVVTANTTELVVINQVMPIEIVFAIPEQQLADITRYAGKGKLKVKAVPQGKQTRIAEGELTFVDNTVKPTTGTIDVKARFPNEDLALWPGQFADVTVTLTTEPDAIVVPAAAVQIGQNGQYVFVVKPDKVVEMRPIELARTVTEEAVIRKGLTPGESVVVDGHIRLFPGAKVELKPAVASDARAGQTASAEEAGKSATSPTR
jgi:multidrug efflux system membrane fusion protein